MPTELLISKLLIPPLRPDLVPRKRLIRLLQGGLQANRQLTLVSAPAGFGKTTLVASWLKTIDHAAAWLSLDESDNDLLRFLTYLAAALQQVDEGIGAPLNNTLQSTQPLAVNEILAALLNKISLRTKPLILVLDDFHLLTKADIFLVIEFILNHLPQQLHLVLTTREDPNLPLARFRARDQLNEIRAWDLRFTQEEADAFLRGVMGLALSPQDVTILEDYTEGWAAGLQLAGLSMQKHTDLPAFITGFSGSNRFILDYLSEEVLRNLTDEIRSFLLKTAVLERLSAPLCDVVTGRNDSDRLLIQIEEMNLFLFQLDHERKWYRYHRLFADILLKQLHKEHRAEISGLHSRASYWYEEQGSVAEAINHAFAAGDTDRLVNLIEAYAMDVIMRGQINLARTWIEALPSDIRQAYGRINMNYAWTLFLGGEFEPLPAILDQIEANTDSVDILGEASALRAFISYNNPGEMQEYAMHALEIVPEENVMVRGLVHMGLANVHEQLGEKREAYEQFAKAIPLHWAAGNKVAATNAVLDLTLQTLALGKWNQTRRIIDELLDFAQKTDSCDDLAIGMAHIGIGWSLLRQNRIDEAISAMKKGLVMAEQGGYRAAGAGQIPLTQAYMLQGNTIETRKLILDFTDNLSSMPEAQIPVVAVWVAHMYLLLNDFDRAEEWLEKYAGVERNYFEITSLRLEIQRAAHQAVEPVYQDLLARLSEIIRRLEELGWNGYLIEALNLRAIIHHAMGNTGKALTDLEQALALAEPEEDLYAFIREGAAIQSLLEQLPDRPFVQTLLHAFPQKIPEAQGGFSHPELVEALSSREVEVLRLMAEGATYNDIAGKLIVSVNTVRYHIKGLYSKLGVSSRSAAITRARKLNIS